MLGLRIWTNETESKKDMKHIISYYSINLIIHYACQLFKISIDEFRSKKPNCLDCKHMIMFYLNYKLGLTEREISEYLDFERRAVQRSIYRKVDVSQTLIDNFECYAENALSKKGFQPELFNTDYTFINRINY